MTIRSGALVVLALSLLFALAGRTTTALMPALDPGDPDSSFQIAIELVWLSYGVLGAIILAKLPRHPIGWIFLSVGAGAGLTTLAAGYAAYALSYSPALPGSSLALWLPSTWWAPSLLVPAVFVPLLFPDGRLPGRRWRPWAWAAGVLIVLWTAGFWFADAPLDEPPGPDNPLGVPGAEALQALSVLQPVLLGLAVSAVVVRRRRATGHEREQLRWLTYAGGVLLAGLTTLLFLGEWGPLPAAATLVGIAFLPVAVTIAVTRYRLYDIDLVINRTLVYGGLTLAILAAYALVVLLAGRALGLEVHWRQSVLVTALIAMAAYPLREVLQRIANRLMYGDRDDPYAAMSRLAQRLADAATPRALLTAVADTIGQALRLPYVAVELTGHPGGTAATYGQPGGEPHRIPLVHQGEPVGTLVLAARDAETRLSTADLRLLDDVARQAAIAAHAAQLTEDLQRARERLVLAREEERRRLRRDLHDGLGSALAGMALQVGNARRALSPDSVGGPDTATAAQWLDRLERHATDAIADLRDVVNDLRPPALDELGLIGALRTHVTAIPLPVDVLAPVRLPPLPAGVEVAAYRIAVEAVTNAVRHAHATCCTVRLAVSDGLVIEVTDDGDGLRTPVDAGVGMSSMRERARELSGECVIRDRVGGGVLVAASLPLPPDGDLR